MNLSFQEWMTQQPDQPSDRPIRDQVRFVVGEGFSHQTEGLDLRPAALTAMTDKISQLHQQIMLDRTASKTDKAISIQLLLIGNLIATLCSSSFSKK